MPLFRIHRQHIPRIRRLSLTSAPQSYSPLDFPANLRHPASPLHLRINLLQHLRSLMPLHLLRLRLERLLQQILREIPRANLLHLGNSLDHFARQPLRDVHQHLIRVSLRHQVSLPIQCVPHFLRVSTHQRVEERLVPHRQTHLRSQNTSQPLCLLSTRSFLPLDLDQHRRFGQIDRRIADFRQEHDAPRGTVPEVVQHALAIRLAAAAVEVAVAEELSELVEREDGVAEDEDFIARGKEKRRRKPALDVDVEEIRERFELLRIDHGEELLLVVLLAASEKLVVEQRVHVAPDLQAAHRGQIAFLCLAPFTNTHVRQVHPVGFVQLGTDQKVQVFDLAVFADQRRGQSQLAVRFDRRNDFLERICGTHVHLVEDQQAPLATRDLVQNRLALLVDFSPFD